MQFAYDATQPHQLAAIDAVVDLFHNHPPVSPRTAVTEIPGGAAIHTMPNCLALSDEELLANLRRVQSRSAVPLSPEGADKVLSRVAHSFPAGEDNGLVSGRTASFPNFSAEMETGTGKTYVYLRTIRELARRYGFSKFIVVTPSIAVREGVLHATRSTAAHLTEVCGISCESVRYDSSKMGRVANFARSASARAMVATIDSIKRDDVLLLRSSEGLIGEVPLHFIQACRPILILDEPQNMESDSSTRALARLNPLFALRYSATHRKSYNMIHRLTPMEAYRSGLVKRIEIDSVEGGDTNAAYFRLLSVKLDGPVPSVKVEANTGTGRRRFTMRRLHTLEDKTGLPHYRGFQLTDIISEPPSAEFTNGAGHVILKEGEAHGATDKEELFRAQISATIQDHFLRQRALRGHGIKVLSLFFIDKVANYRGEGKGDNAPMIRRIFEEEYDRRKRGEWKDIPAAAVHAGYFANSRGGNSEDDAQAYQLIMRDKESLLTFPNPKTDDAETLAKRRVAFIFTHSALREGWDNPNIFQICTLNESVGEMRKRQEIGRGLRLAVDQQGERIEGEDKNLLTIVPNRHYLQYAAEYQREVREDCRSLVRDRFGPMEDMSDEARRFVEKNFSEAAAHPTPKAGAGTARANPLHIKIREVDGKITGFSPEYENLWTRIAQKTRCKVQLDGSQFAADALSFMPPDIPGMEVVAQGGILMVDKKTGWFSTHVSTGIDRMQVSAEGLRPDIASAVDAMLRGSAARLRLSRRTLCRMIQGDKKRAMENPYGWARSAAVAIRAALASFMEKGVVYEKVDGKFHAWRCATKSEVSAVGEHVAKLGNAKNAVYEKIKCDSDTEKRFAEGLLDMREVKLFMKLPDWFSVPTPIGRHYPDWALLLSGEEGGEELVLIVETKAGDTVDEWGIPHLQKLHPEEKAKVECAASNFGSEQLQRKGPLEGTDYQVAREAGHIRRAPRKNG